jgi:hypothetical protein
MNQSLFSQLKRIWLHISALRRFQFILLLGLTLLCSIAEIISLGAVLPFIGIITQPEMIFASPWMTSVAKLLDIKTVTELVLPLTISFAVVALAAGGLRAEITSTVLECEQRVSGDWVDTSDDRERMRRYWEVLQSTPNFRKYHDYVHPEARVGSAWLKFMGDALLD